MSTLLEVPDDAEHYRDEGIYGYTYYKFVGEVPYMYTASGWKETVKPESIKLLPKVKN